MKGLPLSYNRDMQEDKEAIFDSSDTVKECLSILKDLINKTTLKLDNMERSCRKGFLDATALAEYLVEKRVPFREAHEIVGKIVGVCSKSGKELSDVSIKDFKQYSPLIDKGVYKILGVKNYIKQFKSHGSTSPKSVQKQISAWERKLKKLIGESKAARK
jgi:argininosuccinate lyase